jgi:hypothetical protein
MFSDLPAPIMEEHRRTEHLRDSARQLENVEKQQLDRLQVIILLLLVAVVQFMLAR